MKYNPGDTVRVLPHAVMDRPELVGQVVTVTRSSASMVGVRDAQGVPSAALVSEVELVTANPNPPRGAPEQFA